MKDIVEIVDRSSTPPKWRLTEKYLRDLKATLTLSAKPIIQIQPYFDEKFQPQTPVIPQYQIYNRDTNIQYDQQDRPQPIKILCNPADLSQVIGHKRSNILELAKMFPLLQVIPDKNVRLMTIELQC